MNGDANYTVCNNETIKTIKNRVRRLTSLLRSYSAITDAYVLDFFVENHWGSLPSSWQRDLEDLEPTELAEFISNNGKSCVKKVWPLSLLAFKATSFAESLPRDFIKSPQPIRDFVHNSTINKPKCTESNERNVQVLPGLNSSVENKDWELCASEELSLAAGQHKDIHHILRRHVKPKKQHEIMRLLKVIKEVTEKIKCDSIVDVGSGQGHLSRLLAFSTNLHVASLEAESSHISGAQKIDDQVLKNFEKQNRKQLGETEDMPSSSVEFKNLPKHINRFIPSNITSEEFVDVLRKTCEKDNPQHVDLDLCFGLVGLHTCGNLATTLIKVFSHCSQAVALFSVACCYMKLDEETVGKLGTYPLSNWVKAIPEHNLSYISREVACHAIEKYQEKLKGDAPTLKIHCYRATLEALIVKQCPEMKHLGLRSVKNAHTMSFSDYSKEALKKTNIVIAEHNLTSHYVQLCTSQWKRVLVFYSLRLLLATIVETVILLDRMLYLFEEGIDSCLVPLFDPQISPRNQVLIAVKRLID